MAADPACAAIAAAIRDLVRGDAAAQTTVARVREYIDTVDGLALSAAEVRRHIEALDYRVRARVADAVVAPPAVAPPAPAPRRLTLTLTLEMAPSGELSVLRAASAPPDFGVRVDTEARGDDETLPMHVFVARMRA